MKEGVWMKGEEERRCVQEAKRERRRTDERGREERRCRVGGGRREEEGEIGGWDEYRKWVNGERGREEEDGRALGKDGGMRGIEGESKDGRGRREKVSAGS